MSQVPPPPATDAEALGRRRAHALAAIAALPIAPRRTGDERADWKRGMEHMRAVVRVLHAHQSGCGAWDDREVVQAALRKSGLLLYVLSPEWRRDPGLARVARRQNPLAARAAAAELRRPAPTAAAPTAASTSGAVLGGVQEVGEPADQMGTPTELTRHDTAPPQRRARDDCDAAAA